MEIHMTNHPAPTPERVALEQRKFTELGKAATGLRDSIIAIQEGRERYDQPISRRELFLDRELLVVENLHENLQHRQDYLDLVEIEEKERKREAKLEEHRSRVRWTNSHDDVPGETEETARMGHDTTITPSARVREVIDRVLADSEPETREGLAPRVVTSESSDQLILVDPPHPETPWGHTPDDSKHTDEEKN